MSISETKVIDQITVTENGTVLYREATRIIKDGEQIAQTFHRTSLTPGQDLTGHPSGVVTIAEAAWTPECIAAYQATAEANARIMA
jgi:DNA-binding transcriptional LysR family regulator